MDNQPQTPLEGGETLGEAWKYHPEYNRTADFLGLNIYDRQDSRVAQKISALTDWAQEATGKKDLESVLSQVATLQKTLGYHGIGKPLVDQLYQNMRIKQDTKRLQTKPQQKVVKTQQQSNPIEKAISQVVSKTINDIVKQALVKNKMVGGGK